MAERPGLPDGTADVWWARRQDAADRFLALLDETERRRWTAYRRDADRERFLVGCALAKAALAGYAGLRPADVRFDRACQCGEPHGKPAFAGYGLGHSVAHSGDLVAVAVAGNPVGVAPVRRPALPLGLVEQREVPAGRVLPAGPPDVGGPVLEAGDLFITRPFRHCASLTAPSGARVLRGGRPPRP